MYGHVRPRLHLLQHPHRPQYPLPHSVTDHVNLAAVVTLVAAVAVCLGRELEENRGLDPVAAMVAAWESGLGSYSPSAFVHFSISIMALIV